MIESVLAIGDLREEKRNKEAKEDRGGKKNERANTSFKKFRKRGSRGASTSGSFIVVLV